MNYWKLKYLLNSARSSFLLSLAPNAKPKVAMIKAITSFIFMELINIDVLNKNKNDTINLYYVLSQKIVRKN